MDGIDSLLTVAEVAVAFAGFATLAGLIGQDPSRDHPEVDAVRLRNMVTISLVVVALSFVPVVVVGIARSERIGWIASSVIATIWTLACWIRTVGRARRVRHLPGYSIRLDRTVRALAGCSLIGWVVNSTGLPGSFSYEIYLTALLLGLATSGVLFSLVVASLLDRRR